MDYKAVQYKKEIGYYKDILDCIQDGIDKIVEEKYKDDECYPIFCVSSLWINEDNQQIILNCTHLGRTFSRILFPCKESFWGYDGLSSIIESLYNQTM